jgi:hypothetical protein
MITTFERGILEGKRRVVLRQLEAKFGPSLQPILERAEKLPIDDPGNLRLNR